jgi:uncharacterized phage protein (TIGR02220 family)
VYLQSLISAKLQNDDGTLCYKNVAQWAEVLQIKVRTLHKYIEKCSSKGRGGAERGPLQFSKDDCGNLVITIPKYKYYQELSAKELSKTMRETKQKCRKGAAKISPPDPLPDHRIEEQTIPDQEKAKTKEKEEALFGEIISDLNEVLGRTGRKQWKLNDDTKGKIRSRLKEGHTIEDFKHVHRVKQAEWTGTDYEKYLRPITLYSSSKFASYAMQETVIRDTKNDLPQCF